MARAPQSLEVELVPEADRLDGFPHPRETRQLFGHQTAERRVKTGIDTGQLHHALLLTGSEGIGKATLAYRIARYALAAPHERLREGNQLEVLPSSPAAHQVRALSHPGLLVLRRTYDHRAKRFTSGILVDEVRRLRSFLGHTAGEEGWRVVIVDQANHLNANAANALLKSLEEPPPRCLFLLLAPEPGRLIVTIRSRCQRLDLSPLDDESLRQAAHAAIAASDHASPAGDDMATLTGLSGGSVRRFLALATGNGLALTRQVTSILDMGPNGMPGGGHKLAEELAPTAAEPEFSRFFVLLLDEIARRVRSSALGPDPATATVSSPATIAPDKLASWAAMWETIARDKAETEALNLDRKTLILRTLARLEAVTRS